MSLIENTKAFKKFLVISHDASLTGAPVLLINFMRLLKERGYSFNSLIRRDGSLLSSFKEISDMLEVSTRTRNENLREKFKRKLLKKKSELNVKPLLRDVDCVISNTITNGEI